jgi:hypothetical protein
MTLKTILFEDITLEPGEEKRLVPWKGLDVSRYDRLHFHIGTLPGTGVAELEARILFATEVKDDGQSILAGTTIWFEDTVEEREFVFKSPIGYRKTGFIMSVPVVAPKLFDVILENKSDRITRENVYVTVMSQEI